MESEFGFIEWLKSRTPLRSGVRVGIGDDCAVVDAVGTQLITTDMLMDGVDFVLAECGAVSVGRKSMAVNLSDIAAMAGVPTHCVVSIALPRSGGWKVAEELYEGVWEVAREYDVAIVGGDTNTRDGPLVVNVTVWGTPGPQGPILRRGAMPGDLVFVTGELGGSILGRHLNPIPRIREAQALSAAVQLHAMVDISDGFAQDFGHILKASGCGAVIYADKMPVSNAARELATTSGKTPLEHALHDGEDFELVFTVPPEEAEKIPGSGVTVYRVGECIAEGYWLKDGNEQTPMAAKGWSHRMKETR